MGIIKKHGLTFLLVIAIATSIFFTATKSQATTKWALACGVQKGSFDTMNEIYQADTDFESAGYECIAGKNMDANYIYDDLSSDYIFMFSGHGSPGNIHCYNGSKNTYISASGSSSDTYYLENLGANALGKMLVTIYGGCETAVSSSSEGNLLDATYEKGASFVVGWKTTVDVSQHNCWLKAFTNSLSSGNNVSKAILDADDAVEQEFGSSNLGGTNNWTSHGDDNTGDYYTTIK